MTKFFLIIASLLIFSLSLSNCGDGEYEIDTTQGVASNILQ